MRLAVLADIHGNLPALQAVCAALEALQPDYVVLDGDLINGVPFSTDVIDSVRRSDWVVVRGNHEFYYLDFGTPRAVSGSEDAMRWGQLHWLVDRITPEQGAYLAMLPDERTFYLPGTQPVRVAHGVPGRNRTGFYGQQPAATIAAELTDVLERTLISAHTHVQVDRQICLGIDNVVDLHADPHTDPYWHMKDGDHHWHVVNPGSVGLPLNGDPRAQFAMMEAVDDRVEPGGWQVTHHRVAYDRRPALEAYASTGMAEQGGVITELFYWELVTAETEIISFYRWAHDHGYDVDNDLIGAFEAYKARSGRAAYVRERDPLYQRSSAV